MPIFDSISGPGWLNTSKCITKTKQQESCVMENIPKMCMAASHRVTKVLRMTLDNLEYLLQTRDNLKIIHLFRDPHAIINSRIETKWYPITNTQNLLSNAKSLCSKMLYDFHEGLRLYNLYPDRFRFLYYEDLNNDPLGKVKLIYQYLGMSLNQSKYEIISNIKVFNNSKAKTERERNTAFWWRKTLKWDITKQIDEICKDVYDVLGYKTFSSSADQMNWTLKSVVIPSDYVF